MNHDFDRYDGRYDFEDHLRLLKKKARERLLEFETHNLIRYTLQTGLSISIENTHLETVFYNNYLYLIKEYLADDISILDFFRNFQKTQDTIDRVLNDFENDGIAFREQPCNFFELTDEISNLSFEVLEMKKTELCEKKINFYNQIIQKSFIKIKKDLNY